MSYLQNKTKAQLIDIIKKLEAEVSSLKVDLTGLHIENTYLREKMD